MNKSLFFSFFVCVISFGNISSLKEEFDDDGLNFDTKNMKGSVDIEYNIDKQDQTTWTEEKADYKIPIYMIPISMIPISMIPISMIPISIKTNFEEEELPVETNFEEEELPVETNFEEEEVEDYTLKLPRGTDEKQEKITTASLRKSVKKEKVIYVQCQESRFGCCYDGITLKIDHFGTNCLAEIYNGDIQNTPLLPRNGDRLRHP